MSEHAARGRRQKQSTTQPTNAERMPERPGELSQPAAVAGRALPDTDTVLRSSGHTTDPLGGSAIPGDVVSALRRQAGRGTPLPDQLASQLGSELGGDVSSARLHTDAEADSLARSVSAVAFTYGSDIYFSAGSFDPGTESGQHLLAHELSHVVQGQHGSAAGAQGTIGMADDPVEHAAEASASRVVSALRRTASDESAETTPAQTTQAAAAVQPGASSASPVRRKKGRPGKAGSGRVRLSVSEPEEPAAAESAEAEVIRRLLVKVHTSRVKDSKTRVITEVKVEGRAPTTVSKGQGDHTVAETLIVEAIQGICRFQEYWPAYLKLLHNIKTFAEENKIDRYDVDALYKEFAQTDEKAFKELDGEDQVASIEALIDALIRSANKVANSAFAKKEGVTSGGGKEKEAINLIRETAMSGSLGIPTVFWVAEQLVELIDYTEFNQVLADRCVAAVQLACSAAPPLSTKLNLLVPAFVDALIQKRFPQMVGATERLAQAVNEGLGLSTHEVKLSEWGAKEAKQNPQESEGFISPHFEDKLSQQGSPPVPTFNTAPMTTPKVVTTKLKGKKGAKVWSANQIVQQDGSWYLILNAVSSTSGQASYDVAKLEIHEERDTDMGKAGPELWAFVPYNSALYQIVNINRTPKSTVYFLARVA